MKTATLSDLRSLPVILLCIWLPWDVYCRAGYPWYPPITALLVTLLLAGVTSHLLQRKRIHIPFELTWPVALLVILAWTAPALGIESRPLRVTGLALVFLAAVQVLGNRTVAGHSLNAFLGSTGTLALFSLVARTGWIPGVYPAGYDLTSGVTVYASRSVADGVWVLAFGVIAGAAGTASRGHRTRIFPGMVSLSCLSALAITINPALQTGELPFIMRWPEGGVFPWVLIITATWLVARTAARLVVDRIERSDNSVVPLLIATIAGGLLLLFLPIEIRLLHLVLLAVVVAAATRRTEPGPSLRPALAVAPLLFALILPGTLVPDLNNPADPRNYDVAAAADLDAGRLDLLEQRLDYFETLHRGERRTHYWRARVALARGHTRTAATEIRAAMVGTSLIPAESWPVLPWKPEPDAADVQEIRREIRDRLSAGPQPVAHLAYERLLATEAETATIARLMRTRLRQSGSQFASQAETLDLLLHEPFAKALAFLIGHRHEAAAFSDWTPSEMIHLLEQCGAHFAPQPPGIEVPTVWAAYTEPGALLVYDGKEGGILPITLNPATGVTTWWEWQPEEDRVVLRLDGLPGETPLLEADLARGVHPISTAIPHLDDHTALLVRLPGITVSP